MITSNLSFFSFIFHMNQPSEQILPDFRIVLDKDNSLSVKKQQEALRNNLGAEYCSIQKICGKQVFVYNKNEQKIVILHKAITYLGNPHPAHKKRIQLPTEYKNFCIKTNIEHPEIDIRIMGVYHYRGTLVFVDFVKDTYLSKTMHNSSAHVYTNDLYQGLRNGVFHKEDQFGNHIYTIHPCHLTQYLAQEEVGMNELFELFHKFNNGFTFGQWLYSVDMIRKMHGDAWRQWKQTEWAGWYLEYEFEKFTRENNVTHLMRYTGSSNKGNGEGIFDFDIWFERDQFYGDLKASDKEQKETIGNAQEAFVECVSRYGKFWYVIYEHDTIKDGLTTNFAATKERDEFLRELGEDVHEHSEKHRYIKHSVKFQKMAILELNEANYREALIVYNQGRQPNGAARKPKFAIKKSEIDNFVIFRYNYEQA